MTPMFQALLATILISLGATSSSEAQTMPVALDVQIPLLLRVLTFDRAMTAHGASYVVVIVYQSRNRTSMEAKDGAEDAFARDHSLKIGGQPVRIEHVDLDGDEELAAAIQRLNASALYITPLRAVSVEAIAKAARAAKIRTITGVDAYLDHGIAVSVRVRAERPRLAFNLTSCRQEGADYPSQLLALADVAP